MQRYRILIIATAIFLAGGIVLAAWANNRKWLLKQPTQPVKDEVHEYTVEEKAALSELAAVYSHSDSLKLLYVSGDISVKDPSDTTNNIHAGFLFARRFDSIYYALGDDQILSLPDIYLTVNKAVKKIFILPSKKLLAPFHLPVDTLLKMYAEEGYAVQVTRNPPFKTVRLFRSNHISCKEFTVTWQEEEQSLKEVSMRLTDLDDPLNIERDKIVTVKIADWSTLVPRDLFDKNKYVQQGAGQWMPASRLTDYELFVP